MADSKEPKGISDLLTVPANAATADMYSILERIVPELQGLSIPDNYFDLPKLASDKEKKLIKEMKELLWDWKSMDQLRVDRSGDAGGYRGYGFERGLPGRPSMDDLGGSAGLWSLLEEMQNPSNKMREWRDRMPYLPWGLEKGFKDEYSDEELSLRHLPKGMDSWATIPHRMINPEDDGADYFYRQDPFPLLQEPRQRPTDKGIEKLLPWMDDGRPNYPHLDDTLRSFMFKRNT